MEKLALSVVIGGAIASSFNSSIKSSTKSLSQIGSEINKMNKQKINVRRFKELRKNTQGNRKEFLKLGRSLKKSGYDLSNFSQKTRILNKDLLSLKKNLLIKGKIEIEKSNFMSQKDSLLATVGTGMAIGGVINLRSEVMQAQGELQSLGLGKTGLSAITKEAKEFSNTFAGTTTPQFIKASYDIKSGISSLSATAVGKYTRMAAITAGATKSSTEQMTSFFATGYGIYRKQYEKFASKNIKGWNKLSKEEKDIKFGESFSAGIGSAVKMFKTDGVKMQGAIETLGATATTSNVAQHEQIAILGQMQKSFASGSEAATAYKGFLTGAVGAQEALGLEFLDVNNQLKSAPLILEELRSKYGETLDDLEKEEIQKAFGTEEGMKFINSFYGEVDELRTNIDELGSSMNNGTKTVDEMMKATQRGKGFNLLGQQVLNLGASIGKILYPAVSLLSWGIGNVVMGLDFLINSFPMLSTGIGSVVVGLFTLITVMKVSKLVSFGYRVSMLALRGSFLGNIGMLKTMRLGLARFNIMTSLATAKQWLFNIALNANPIGLIITGVAALIGLGVLLYKNFEPFKNLIDGIVGGIGSVVSSVGGFFGFGNSEEKKSKKIFLNGRELEGEEKKNHLKMKAQRKNLRNDTPGSTLRKVTAATAVSSQLVAAQPNLSYTPVPKVDVEKVRESRTPKIEVKKIEINNPKSTVDVEKGIQRGMAKSTSSLNDKEI